MAVFFTLYVYRVVLMCSHFLDTSPVFSFTDDTVAMNYGLFSLKGLRGCRLAKNPWGSLQKFLPEPLIPADTAVRQSWAWWTGPGPVRKSQGVYSSSSPPPSLPLLLPGCPLNEAMEEKESSKREAFGKTRQLALTSRPSWRLDIVHCCLDTNKMSNETCWNHVSPAFTFYQNQFLTLFILKFPRDAGNSVIATKENPGKHISQKWSVDWREHAGRRLTSFLLMKKLAGIEKWWRSAQYALVHSIITL